MHDGPRGDVPRGPDGITVEIIRHALLSAAGEMARNLCRTAYNTVVYEIHDYSVNLQDAAGDVVADAPGIAVAMRGNDYGIKKGLEFVGADNMRPGDVFLLNYPYWSSAHTLDPLMFAPIHVDGVLVGFASCRIHSLDFKQKDPGYVLDSTDMYQEGMVFPASRLYEQGVPNEDVFGVIRFNSRLPERTIGDLQAQATACKTGVRRVQEIAEKFGTATLVRAMAAINDHGEVLTRQALATLPKGTWTAEDFIDSDGVDVEKMVRAHVTVTITDDEFVIDWTGSDSGVRGPINLPFGKTEAFSSLIFKALTTPDTPVVAGNFRPLRVIAPEGSVMHAVPPMPTFTQWTALVCAEVILKALAQGMPDRVPASSGGDVCSMMGLGVNPRNNQPWLEATNEAVGFGGHAGGDGADGIMHISEPGCRNNPVEVLEHKSPMFIESYGYRPDSGGAGKYRGGVGIGRAYRYTAPGVGICLVYKTKTRPWPIGGGTPGDPNHIVLNPGTDREVRQGGSYNHLAAGDVLVNNTGGGGGYGDPFDRDPELVARDVRNGFVGVPAAAEQYGVAVDPHDFSVDRSATARLRARKVQS
jgi:N-methylhydantoinase B